MAAVNGMSGQCFDGPVVCVVSSIWGQWYVCYMVYVVSGMQNKWYWDQLHVWLVVCRVIGAKMSAM